MFESWLILSPLSVVLHRNPLQRNGDQPPPTQSDERAISLSWTANGFVDGLAAPAKGRARTGILDNAHGHAAVDNDIFSCDEIILNQTDNHLCDIFRLALSVQWDTVVNI